MMPCCSRRPANPLEGSILLYGSNIATKELSDKLSQTVGRGSAVKLWDEMQYLPGSTIPLQVGHPSRRTHEVLSAALLPTQTAGGQIAFASINDPSGHTTSLVSQRDSPLIHGHLAAQEGLDYAPISNGKTSIPVHTVLAYTSLDKIARHTPRQDLMKEITAQPYFLRGSTRPVRHALGTLSRNDLRQLEGTLQKRLGGGSDGALSARMLCQYLARTFNLVGSASTVNLTPRNNRFDTVVDAFHKSAPRAITSRFQLLGGGTAFEHNQTLIGSHFNAIVCRDCVRSPRAARLPCSQCLGLHAGNLEGTPVKVPPSEINEFRHLMQAPSHLSGTSMKESEQKEEECTAEDGGAAGANITSSVVADEEFAPRRPEEDKQQAIVVAEAVQNANGGKPADEPGEEPEENKEPPAPALMKNFSGGKRFKVPDPESVLKGQVTDPNPPSIMGKATGTPYIDDVSAVYNQYAGEDARLSKKELGDSVKSLHILEDVDSETIKSEKLPAEEAPKGPTAEEIVAQKIVDPPAPLLEQSPVWDPSKCVQDPSDPRNESHVNYTEEKDTPAPAAAKSGKPENKPQNPNPDLTP